MSPRLPVNNSQTITDFLNLQKSQLAEDTSEDSYRFAFDDQAFLARRETLGLRFQLELLKPEILLHERGIDLLNCRLFFNLSVVHGLSERVGVAGSGRVKFVGVRLWQSTDVDPMLGTVALLLRRQRGAGRGGGGVTGHLLSKGHGLSCGACGRRLVGEGEAGGRGGSRRVVGEPRSRRRL